MYFGSVRFFKHLIITVILLLILVPTTLCVILFIDNSGKAAEIDRLNSIISSEKPGETSSTEGETLSSSADDEVPLSKLYTNCYVSAYSGKYEKTENTVFLTVDGKITENTEKLLDYLDEKKAKITFFVTPDDSELCKRVLERMANSGHTVAILSSSDDIEKIYSSAQSYLNDFSKAFDKIFSITGRKPSLVRFPGGSISEDNNAVSKDITSEITRRGFSYFDWNVDGDNWIHSDNSQIYHDASDIAYSYDAPIIKFSSDSSEEKLKLIKYVVSVMKENGYTLSALTQSIEPVHFR